MSPKPGKSPPGRQALPPLSLIAKISMFLVVIVFVGLLINTSIFISEISNKARAEELNKELNSCYNVTDLGLVQLDQWNEIALDSVRKKILDTFDIPKSHDQVTIYTQQTNIPFYLSIFIKNDDDCIISWSIMSFSKYAEIFGVPFKVVHDSKYGF